MTTTLSAQQIERFDRDGYLFFPSLFTSEEIGRLNFIIYGAILVGMMLLRPQGILPSRVREQELKHAAVQEEEAAVEMTHAS